MTSENEKRARNNEASKRYYQKTKGADQKRYRDKNKDKIAEQTKERKERYRAQGRCNVCGLTPLVSETMCQKCCDRCMGNYNDRKKKVYDHYGWECRCCGTTEEAFLTVDHVNNDGAEHRKTFASAGSGCAIYSWLIKNNFPDGFQILCWNCQWGKKKFGVCPHQNPDSPLYMGDKHGHHL